MHFLAETPEPKRAHGMEVVVYVILSLHLLSCSIITACVPALIIAHMPPIVTCFFHAHVHSRFTTDREVFVPHTCRLLSSPPIVKCYFHLHVNSRFTSDREGWSSLFVAIPSR